MNLTNKIHRLLFPALAAEVAELRSFKIRAQLTIKSLHEQLIAEKLANNPQPVPEQPTTNESQ